MSLSATVRGALESFAQQDVAALDVVERIGAAHPEYASGRMGELLPAPPPDAVLQSARRWVDELAPTIVDGQLLFGRLAIVLFCLLDASSASAAERTGLLWQVAAEVYPSLPSALSDKGKDLLRRRSRLLAAAVGLTTPTIEVRGTPGERPLLALAAQTIAEPDAVAEWAVLDGGVVYRGRADQSERVLDGFAVTGLRWGRHGILLVGHDKGLAECAPGGTVKHHPQWGPVEELAVSNGIALVVSEGVFLSGIPDIEEPISFRSRPNEGIVKYEGVVEHVAGWPDDHWAFTAGNNLIIFSPETGRWDVSSFSSHPITALAAGRDGDVVLGCADGSVVFLRRSDDPRNPSEVVGPMPTAEPVTLLDAGPAGLAATTTASPPGEAVVVWRTGREIARIAHSVSIRAVSLSPDGAALGTIDAEGVLRVWRIDSASAFQLTSYTPDSISGEDLLGISGTVDALAALVSACVVQPPLSVGLFGTWGAGKTFFLRQLRQRVAEITEDARQSGRRQRDLWAWRNVSQVWFNAWNYASADVWAGLVDHLLRELTQARVPAGDLPATLEDRRQQRVLRLSNAQQSYQEAARNLENAEQKRQQAESLLEEARASLKEAEATVDQTRSATVDASFAEAREAVKEAVRDVGLAPVGDTLAALQAALTGARQVLLSGRGLLLSPRLVMVAIAGPLAALIVGLLVHLVAPHVTGLVSITTGLVAALGALAAWLRSATAWAEKRLNMVRTAEESLRQQTARHEQTLAEAQAELIKRAEEVARAEQQARLYQDAVAAAQVAVEADTAATLLSEYITERVTSGDYRSQLGLIGTVREDVETISQAVSAHNANLMESIEQPSNDDAVNRVVLYIDDLDRCPPQVVVKVLEAISLLLSYPLFVVVVAVDARWVSRALATVYPEMLATTEVTPEDYLEKIFQLPVWLDPLETHAARGMLEALLGGSGEVRTPPTHADPGEAPNGTLRRQQPDRPSPTADHGTSDAQIDPASQPQYLATSPPSALRVSAPERERLTALAPLLTRSPRALKRYLNTYRLLKASVRDPDQLKLAQVLLAVSSGRPRAGEVLLRVLASNDGGETLQDAVAQLQEEDRKWLTAALPSSVVDLRQWSRDDARALVPHVRRYTFRCAAQGIGPTDIVTGTSAAGIGPAARGESGTTVEE